MTSMCQLIQNFRVCIRMYLRIIDLSINIFLYFCNVLENIFFRFCYRNNDVKSFKCRCISEMDNRYKFRTVYPVWVGIQSVILYKIKLEYLHLLRLLYDIFYTYYKFYITSLRSKLSLLLSSHFGRCSYLKVKFFMLLETIWCHTTHTTTNMINTFLNDFPI